jgi:hypothetical protein
MMKKSGVKAQSALEYLTTYSWAILLLAVVMASLFMLGVFSPAKSLPSGCYLPFFSCINVVMSSTGGLFLNIFQSGQSDVIITSIRCSADSTSTGNFVPINQLVVHRNSNATAYIQCYSQGKTYSSPVGSTFLGYLTINYTNADTGMYSSATGQVVATVLAASFV